MGVLPRIASLATGMDRLTLYREGKSRPARVDLTKIVGAASDRHVEIMLDDLSEVYYNAGREHIEDVFGDSITAISPDGEVTFEHAATRRFDVIVGVDGCTRMSDVWCSVTRPGSPGSLVDTSRWCQCLNRLHPQAR